MSSSKSTPPKCPVGEAQCDIIDELISLKSQYEELSELVRTDPLTSLFNFRHFIKSLEQEMERTRRSLQPTTLIIIDLDYFKKVNDTWGHDTGNQALVQTAQLMQQAVRKLDIPCRYGGEEFTIILPSTDLFIGIQVAERLRKLIESTPLTVEKEEIKLTASLGVDVFNPSDQDTPESLVKRTDQYLYKAKNEGRNRVEHAIDKRMEPPTQVNADEKDALFGMFGSNDDSDDSPEA